MDCSENILQGVHVPGIAGIINVSPSRCSVSVSFGIEGSSYPAVKTGPDQSLKLTQEALFFHGNGSIERDPIIVWSFGVGDPDKFLELNPSERPCDAPPRTASPRTSR